MKGVVLAIFALTVFVRLHAQDAYIKDSIKVSDIKQKYIALYLTGSKGTSSRGIQALVDFGQNIPKGQNQSSYPPLTDGKVKFIFSSEVGFINILDRNGFDYVDRKISDLYEVLLFRRRD